VVLRLALQPVLSGRAAVIVITKKKLCLHEATRSKENDMFALTPVTLIAAAVIAAVIVVVFVVCIRNELK
jgi:hypothetical protein